MELIAEVVEAFIIYVWILLYYVPEGRQVMCQQPACGFTDILEFILAINLCIYQVRFQDHSVAVRAVLCIEIEIVDNIPIHASGKHKFVINKVDT